jgi:hypothetical protein
LADFGRSQSFKGCGRKVRVRREWLMHGGRITEEKGHPWHAALVHDIDGYFCGGTLISRMVVVTAAHCVVRNKTTLATSDFQVVVGMHRLEDLYEDNDLGDRQELSMRVRRILRLKTSAHSLSLQPSRVISHRRFDPKTYDFDLALVLLDSPGFKLTISVRPICLWNDENDFRLIQGEVGKVVGWGQTESQSESEVLLEADMRVESHLNCYLKNRKFFSKHLKPGTNFCAGGSGIFSTHRKF